MCDFRLHLFKLGTGYLCMRWVVNAQANVDMPTPRWLLNILLQDFLDYLRGDGLMDSKR
jgi:hypothetical protein